MQVMQRSGEFAILEVEKLLFSGAMPFLFSIIFELLGSLCLVLVDVQQPNSYLDMAYEIH